ncbi:hypothetical protein [Methanogenium organophilum]|uniref:Uncharacterized protein n=1 Tax=Methanogenium organophilum TaxID=2199 RepID=A0A9X9T8F1_METOG|nr:hypothetical protein [Methanogenium organophilum]WAI01092.1 hypothetical protein OU421_11820 [Methanogenium organophilum]
MKTEMNASGIHLHKDENNPETGGIWEDAGFCPPQCYLQLTEFLHITFLHEGCIPEYYLHEIIEMIRSPCNNGGFVVHDRKRMLCFAESLGIDVLSGDEDRIAAGITASIISDYLPPDGISSATEKMIFFNKNGLAREQSTLKV